MSLTKLNIPNIIKVGFQKRSDTYTGKLAYVVYKDKKGVLRKEKSWDGWRDNKIAAKEYKNEPTEGFVLNKKVGETSWGWNPRKAWVRVYDPRDFEFEISVANLVFILEECSAIKGKGLEGEFVYAWDRAELVLLPVTSQEYKASIDFTDLQTKKLNKTDMVEGCMYRTKNDEEVLYLGRHPWYYTSQKWVEDPEPRKKDASWRYYYHRNGHYATVHHDAKKHIFVSLDKKIKIWDYDYNSRNSGSHHYWVQTGFTKLAERLTEEPSSQFAAEFEKFKNSKHGKPPKQKTKKTKAKTK